MKKGDLKEEIMRELMGGGGDMPLFVKRMTKVTKFSAQAIYKNIRLLKSEGVVVISGKNIDLSLLYLENQKSRISNALKVLQNNILINKLIKNDGEKLEYAFDNHTEFDLFWTHIYTLVSHSLRHDVSEEARYMILPHDYFYYAFAPTDTFWVESNITKDKENRLVLTHPTPLDLKVLSARAKVLSKSFKYLIDVNALKQSEREYINVIGNIIIVGKVDARFNIRLKEFLSKTKSLPLTQIQRSEIESIIKQKGQYKLRIFNSVKKAEEIRNKYKKYFG